MRFDPPPQSNRRATAFDLAVQAALVVGCALLYFAVRGVTEGSTAAAVRNGYRILELESAVGVAVEETAQNVVLGHQVLTTLANWVYIWGHWPVIAATLVWLYRTSRRDYLLLRNAMFVSGAIGLVIFALHPVAPPRHLPDMFVDTVTELSRSYRILQPPQLVNEYAAVPSLHVGWNLLVGIFLFKVGRNWVVRSLGVISPVLMAIAVVVTANHYVLDGVIGSAVALVGLAGSLALWRLFYGRPTRQVQVVHDQPGDTPARQQLRPPAVGHTPGEHLATGGELGDEAGGQQSLVDGDAVGCCR
jgi:hypothetical protein